MRVHDGNGDRLLATVTPFPRHAGSVSVAMGDDDGDGVQLKPINGSGHPATTSTTSGADLLVSGVASQGPSASVARYGLTRPHAQATMLEARRPGDVFSAAGSQAAILGGD